MTEKRELYFRSDAYRHTLKKGEEVMWLVKDHLPIRLTVGDINATNDGLHLCDSSGKKVVVVSRSELDVPAFARISLFARFDDLEPDEIAELVTRRIST